MDIPMELSVIADMPSIPVGWKELIIKSRLLSVTAFGFHDEEYFSLIIKDALATSN